MKKTESALIGFGIIVMLIWAISFGQFQATKIYDNGFTSGERQGFEAGYINCYNGLGLQWLGSRQRFAEFSREYGNIHNTPWEKFTIEEKVTIAMYGGSGSTLEVKELAEFIANYGPPHLREHYSNLEEWGIE